jgi:hypothetical protein
MTPPNGTEHRAIVDTHRHPIGPKLAAKMAERGLYDPKQEFPQTNAQDLICYREFFDLEYAMPKQREGGVTLSLASSGGGWSGLRGICFRSAPARPSSS